MKKIFNKYWLKATGVRAIETMVEVAVGFILVGLSVGDIDWTKLVQVALIAGVSCVLYSIKGVPKAECVAETDEAQG